MWSTLAGTAILITYKHKFLLRTDDSCLAQVTLMARFQQLKWESGGSENYANNPTSTHPCVIAQVTGVGSDWVLTRGGAPARLYLKAGEADGAQDGNKDRAYFSTSIRTNVDYPTGLGAFNSGACSAPNCENDVGGVDGSGNLSDIAPPAPTSEFYGIYIR